VPNYNVSCGDNETTSRYARSSLCIIIIGRSATKICMALGKEVEVAAALKCQCQFVGLVVQLRGGSRILQGLVSNPSKRGTVGRASKAPRGCDLRRGLCPLPQKNCSFYMKMVSFYALPVIY